MIQKSSTTKGKPEQRRRTDGEAGAQIHVIRSRTHTYPLINYVYIYSKQIQRSGCNNKLSFPQSSPFRSFMLCEQASLMNGV